MKKLLVVLVLILGGIAQAEGLNRNILIFDSYHEGFDWSDSLLKTIKTELQTSASFYTEHLDSKRFHHLDSTLFNFISKKYSGIHIDLLIACDNYSLDFLIKYHDILFSNVPVVFTGINNYSDELIKGKRHLFTGVTEAHDIRATLQLIKTLQPEVTDVFVIHDNTASGLANRALIEHVVSDFSSLKCHFANNLPTEQLLEKVSELGKTWVVLYASFYRDLLGRYFSSYEAITMLSSRSKVPIYAINDNTLGYGVLGGNMINAVCQGKQAVKLAQRVLAGEDVRSVQVMTQSVNQYMFDYEQLKKYKIDLKKIPSGSVVINKPQPFYLINKTVFWAVVTSLVVLIGIVFFIFINVNRRKRAEVALGESEGTIRQIAENINEAYWLRTKDSIVYVSPAFDKIFGRSREVFVKNPQELIEYVYEEDRNQIKLNVDSTANKIETDKEIRIVHPSGEIRWIRYRSFPIRDQVGKIYRVAEVAEDITEKKITGDEILKTQKLESLGLLAGGIAHDFNNLLSGVMGYLDLARMALNAEDKAKVFENLSESLNVCRKARELTNRLLTFSKGGIPIKKVKSLAEIILSAIEMVHSNTSGNIKCNLPDDMPLCNVDEGLIRQAFYNIILNACQAIDKNGVVNIEAKWKTEGRGVDASTILEVFVRDNGDGIKKENLFKIFDPFFTTKAKGNGLGLSAAFSIVANHGGTIRVDSQEGGGTEFCIALPAIDPGNQQKALEQTDTSKSRSVRVLWLDDEPYIAKMAESILTSFGFEVISTTNSKNALDIFGESVKNGVNFDMVVLDLNIKGGMGGKDVLAKMIEQCPGVVAVACSGYSDDPVMSDPRRFGFKYALRKPYTAHELQTALTTVLSS